jgi:hypothetical protein
MGWGGDGACDAGSREENAGAAAAARVLCCALRLSCQCLRALCVWRVLQETLTGFEVCCFTSQRVTSGCMKRAAAFILVCRLLLPPALQADPTFSTLQQTETAFRCFAMWLLMLMASTSQTSSSNCPPPPSASHLFSSFSCGKLILLFFFRQRTPLHFSSGNGQLEICRLLLQCNADVDAKDAE